MFPSNPDLPPKSLQIRQDDKFFSRLMSKETSIANPSFRVYYGGAAGAVPFNWESRPGTPKHTFSSTHLPPLNPPPSFHSISHEYPKKKPTKSSPFSIIIPRLTLKKNQPSPSLSPSISSPSPRSANSHGGRRFSSFRSSSSSVSSWGGDEDLTGSPTTPLCFGAGRGGGLRGCYSMVIVKNALLSVVGGGFSNGHGSTRGTAQG